MWRMHGIQSAFSFKKMMGPTRHIYPSPLPPSLSLFTHSGHRDIGGVGRADDLGAHTLSRLRRRGRGMRRPRRRGMRWRRRLWRGMQWRRGKSRRSRRTHTLVSVVERWAAMAARHAEAAAGRDAGQPGPLPGRGKRGGDIAMPVSCKYSNNSAGSPPAARRGATRWR